MSIAQRIKQMAKEQLEQSGLSKIFSNTPLGQPFLGEVQRCNYFEGGYEVPIKVKYEDDIIGLGSYMVSKDGKEHRFPDKETVAGILKQGLQLTSMKKESEKQSKIIEDYIGFLHEMDFLITRFGYKNYNEFKKDVENRTAPPDKVEKFIKEMIEQVPQLNLDFFKCMSNHTLKLDVFPHILANYVLEGDIIDKKADKAVDIFIALNRYYGEYSFILEECARREEQNDYPVFYEPIIIKVKKDGIKEEFVKDRFTLSNRDLEMKMNAMNEAVESNLKILKSL